MQKSKMTSRLTKLLKEYGKSRNEIIFEKANYSSFFDACSVAGERMLTLYVERTKKMVKEGLVSRDQAYADRSRVYLDTAEYYYVNISHQS